MQKFKQKSFRCYNLTKSVISSYVLPKNLDELRITLKEAKNQNYNITLKAGGNSYSDTFLGTKKLLVDVSKLNSIKSFDDSNGIIVVEPGVRIGIILQHIMPKNWGLVGLSGSVMDQIGGMLSSNTHGKDTWKNGNFSQNILSCKILLADGTVEEITKDKNSKLFNGVIGGLGFLGIIIEITMKLTAIPSYMVQSSRKKIQNLDGLINHFFTLEKSETDFSYALLDPFVSEHQYGRGLCESAKYIDSKNCDTSIFEKNLSPRKKIFSLKPKIFWSIVRPFWNNSSSSFLNKLKYMRSSNSFSHQQILPFPKIQYAYSDLPNFNLLYSPLGFFELQSLFPKKDVFPAFNQLLSLSKIFKCQPWVCMIKRHKPDSSYLSFAGDGLSIAMNFPLNHLNSEKQKQYSDKLYEIILNNNGKIYIAKHSLIRDDIFHLMYPNYKDMLNLKEKYDPNNLFNSDATDRLLKI